MDAPQDWHTYARTRGREEAERMRQAALRASARQHWFSEEPLPCVVSQQQHWLEDREPIAEGDARYYRPRTVTPEELATEVLASLDRLAQRMCVLERRLTAIEDHLTKP